MMHIPSKTELDRAHRQFLMKESRDLFYKVAVELISLALKNKTSISLAEAVLILLQTWNRSYYRFRKLTADHIVYLERRIADNLDALEEFRKRPPSHVIPDEAAKVSIIFEAFEAVLGPVGAGKAIHLFAPDSFPLWDRTIARKGYSINLAKSGHNGLNYVKFSRQVFEQLDKIKQEVPDCTLKLLDEYNYCKFTKHWI